MDVAALGIEIDSSKVVRARDELGRFVSAAKAASTANDNLAGAADRAGNQMAGAAASASAEAAAVSRSVGPLKAAEAAHNQVNRVIRAGNYQRTNLIAQLNDVGVSLASGQALWMVAIQQGSQIATIWGPEEGGVGRAFKETGALAKQLVSKAGPLLAVGAAVGIMFAGWTRDIQRNGHANVTFVDVVIGAWELLVQKAKSIFGSVFSGVWEDFLKGLDKVVKSTMREVNVIIAAFAAAGKAIVVIWNHLPAAVGDYAIEATNLVLGSIEKMINGAIDLLNKFTGSVKDNIGLDLGQMGQVNLGDISNPFKGAGTKLTDGLQDAVGGAFKTDYLSGFIGALGDKAQEVHNRPSDKERKAAQKEAERQRKAYDDLTRSAQQYVDQQRLEAQAIGLTEEAAARLRYEQDLLNRAANDNIDLTPKMTENLKGLAAQMAEAETSTSKLRDAYDFAKGTFQGFFEDFRSGLASGESVWNSFAAAATNALDTISSKLLELVTSQAFDMLIGGGRGGGGNGILSTLLSAFAGGLGAPAAGGIYANGAAFAGGNVIPFARGGVVTRPTLFPMASGAGLMGEAGPEAVMPLRRGRDGKLGVAADGQQAGPVSVSVNIVNNAGADVNAKTSRGPDGGLQLDVMIDKVVADKLATPGTQSSRALRSQYGVRQGLRKT